MEAEKPSKPVVLTVPLKSDVWDRTPHGIRRLAVDHNCDDCGALTVAVTRQLETIRQACKLADRVFLVLCVACAKVRTDVEKEPIRYSVVDPELIRELRKHQAEMN